MSYQRVIPRDLFNEGNLLKCLGQLYLNLEVLNLEGVVMDHYEGEGFEICRTQDGDLYVGNIVLHIRDVPYTFLRPLNSRRSYPGYILKLDQDRLDVFNEDGTFTPEFISYLKE